MEMDIRDKRGRRRSTTISTAALPQYILVPDAADDASTDDASEIKLSEGILIGSSHSQSEHIQAAAALDQPLLHSDPKASSQGRRYSTGASVEYGSQGSLQQQDVVVITDAALRRRVLEKYSAAWPGMWIARHEQLYSAPPTVSQHTSPSALPGEPTSASSRGMSRLAFVFLLVTNMFGGSVLTIPYAFSSTGTLGGILVVIAMSFVCCHTACMLVEIGMSQRIVDFAELFGERFGRTARLIATGSCIYIFVMVLCAYHTFLTTTVQNLAPSAHLSSLKGSSCVAALCFICLLPKDPKHANMLSSFGSAFILYVAIFIVVEAARQMNFTTEAQSLMSPRSLIVWSQVTGAAPAMMLGMLSPHPYVLVFAGMVERPGCTRAAAILQTKADVRVAFAIVVVSVLSVGITSSVAFRTFTLPQNFVTFFHNDTYAASASSAVCCAIFGAYLSIANILRITLLGMLRSDGSVYPSAVVVFLCNATIVLISATAAALRLRGGTILALGTAGAALVQNFAGPALLQMKEDLACASRSSGMQLWRDTALHGLIICFGLVILGSTVHGSV